MLTLARVAGVRWRIVRTDISGRIMERLSPSATEIGAPLGGDRMLQRRGLIGALLTVAMIVAGLTGCGEPVEDVR